MARCLATNLGTFFSMCQIHHTLSMRPPQTLLLSNEDREKAVGPPIESEEGEEAVQCVCTVVAVVGTHSTTTRHYCTTKCLPIFF